MEGAGDDLFNHGTDGRQKKTLRRAPEIGHGRPPPFVSRIIALERELASLDAEIARKMNALVHALYSLSLEEIETVEKG
jgi:hypothetical protein